MCAWRVSEHIVLVQDDVTWHEDNWGNLESKFLAFTWVIPTKIYIKKNYCCYIYTKLLEYWSVCVVFTGSTRIAARTFTWHSTLMTSSSRSLFLRHQRTRHGFAWLVRFSITVLLRMLFVYDIYCMWIIIRLTLIWSLQMTLSRKESRGSKAPTIWPLIPPFFLKPKCNSESITRLGCRWIRWVDFSVSVCVCMLFSNLLQFTSHGAVFQWLFGVRTSDHGRWRLKMITCTLVIWNKLK